MLIFGGCWKYLLSVGLYYLYCEDVVWKVLLL